MAFESLIDSLLQGNELIDEDNEAPNERKITIAQRHVNGINGVKAHSMSQKKPQWHEHVMGQSARPKFRYAYSEDSASDDHFRCTRCGADNQPFCSPAAPHVPIRQRLNSRRCTSVDASNDVESLALSASNPYLSGRRRRMSLLQTLRYQNKQLADSGFECQHSDKTDREVSSPPGPKMYSESPPSSPIEEEVIQKTSTSSFTKLKAKTKALFVKKSERKRSSDPRGLPSDISSRCCASDNERAIYSCIDFNGKEKAHRKSPSTNDSGHGSQGRLCADDDHQDEAAGRERKVGRQTVAVIERPPYGRFAKQIARGVQLRRSISCPQLGLNLRIYHEIFRRAISMRNRGNSLGTETDEEDEDIDDELECIARELNQQVSEIKRTSHRSPQSPKSERSVEAEGLVQKDEIKFAERMLRNSSPLSMADYLLEKRIQMRSLLLERQREVNALRTEHPKTVSQPSSRHPVMCGAPTLIASRSGSTNDACTEEELNNNDDETAKLERTAVGDADSRSASTPISEEFDEDDNASTILLDQYLPIVSELYPRGRQHSQRSSSQSSLPNRSEEEEDVLAECEGKVGSVTQTDLSLIRISEQLSAYLDELGLGGIEEGLVHDKEGMNFLAKHFYQYQSFVNLPHKAVQLHKTPPSQAGSDPSASWAPKSMTRAGKNQSAPGARANRNNSDCRPGTNRHGRACKHEFRQWGERHGELKQEKVAPHKDGWTKFLSNEETGKRNMFECDFEDRMLQTEPETLQERLSREENGVDIDLSIANASAARGSGGCGTEVLTILTYAPQVQFVTTTVKKAKCLPFNNRPFARVMLFEGRRLLEQKQTTITPSVACNGCVSSGVRAKPTCSSNSSASSSTVSSGSIKSTDAVFSESFLFHISPQMLDRCHIVIEMFDTNPEEAEKGPQAVGHCVVGPICSGSGCAHWLQMVRKNGLPVCMWHRMIGS